MAETQKPEQAQEQEQANALQQEPAAAVNVADIIQQKAMELDQLMSEQLVNAEPSELITMTEVLADKDGAFAKKAEELGLKEWDEFAAAQEKIGALRQEFMDVEKQRSDNANRAANMIPGGEEQAGAIQKKSGISGLIGAVLGGAGSAFLASKISDRKAVQGVAGVLGGILSGGLAAIFSVRRNVKKAMNEAQQPLDGQVSNEELEQKSAALQQELTLAQQQSIEGIHDAMVMGMVKQQVAADKQAEQEAAKQQEGNAPEAEKLTEQENAAVKPEFERIMEAEGMGPGQAPAQPGAAVPQSPQAGQPHPQQGGQPAPLEDMVAQRAAEHASEQPPAGSRAEAIMRERAAAQGAQQAQR